MKQLSLRAAAVLLAAVVFSMAAGWTFAGDTGEDSKDPAPALKGRVMHTVRWDQHRQNANGWYQRCGQSDKIRSENTFWSGEKFMLEAEAEGKDLPASVSAAIQGTGFTAELHREKDCYRGELFNPEMLFLWGNTEPEPLHFIFEAEIDGTVCRIQQPVTVDNREPYWLLHRKE